MDPLEKPNTLSGKIFSSLDDQISEDSSEDEMEVTSQANTNGVADHSHGVKTEEDISLVKEGVMPQANGDHKPKEEDKAVTPLDRRVSEASTVAEMEVSELEKSSEETLPAAVTVASDLSSVVKSPKQKEKETDIVIDDKPVHDQDSSMFFKLKEKNEANYTDEIGKNEAEFFAQGKVNEKNMAPDMKSENFMEEISEEEIDEKYDETATDKTKVRTLDRFSAYDKFGNMISLNDILEKPYYNYVDQIVVYGTVVLPFEEKMKLPPVGRPLGSKRDLVRHMLEKPIPRGFRQSDFCSLTPKNYKQKIIEGKKSKSVSKLSTPAKKKSPSHMTNLHFDSPHYVPDISTYEAHEKGKSLLAGVQMPLKVGTIRVLSLGEIVYEGGDAHLYHTPKHLFPIGFVSVRQYTSVLDPNLKVNYTSEIIRGDKGPIFKVTHEGGGPCFEATTSSAVWLQILKALNEKRVALGVAPKGTAISGPEMMGFAHKKIAAVIEGLEGADQCRAYVFRAQRVESGPASRTPKRKYAELVVSSAASPASVLGMSTNNQSEEIQTHLAEEVNEIEALKKKLKLDNQQTEKTTPAKSSPVAESTEPLIPTLSDEDVSRVKRISKSLSLMSTNEEKHILLALEQLKDVNVNVTILFQTGLGNIVNRLRKHPSTDVGSHAKMLKKKWVKQSKDDEEVMFSEEDLAKAKKVCAKIASYIGFGDEAPPANIKTHLSKSAPRIKLLEALTELDEGFTYIPGSVLLETQVGKRVNKLRKHLDEDIQTVALKLKGVWKKQIAEEELKEEKLMLTEVKNKSNVLLGTNVSKKNGSTSKSNGLGFSANDFSENIDIVKPKTIVLDPAAEATASEAWSRWSSERKRVKLTSVVCLEITHQDKDATLWIVTKTARYRIAGERVPSVPSHRYYGHFKDAFLSFQSAYLTIRKIKVEQNTLSLANIPADLSANAERRAKLRMMLLMVSKIISASTYCPCPIGNESGEGSLTKKLVKITKDERLRRLNFDIIVFSYEVVVDELTRISEDLAEINKWLEHWFVDILVLRGNCYHAKRKRDGLKREKDFFGGAAPLINPALLGKSARSTGLVQTKKTKELAGKKMVNDGINLPDDIEVLCDDLMPRENQKYWFLPKETLLECPKPSSFNATIDWSSLRIDELLDAFSPAPGDEAKALRKTIVCHNPDDQNCHKDLFGALLSLWIGLVQVDEVVDSLPEELMANFLLFRKKFETGRLSSVHKKLLQYILQEESSNSNLNKISEFEQNEASTSKPTFIYDDTPFQITTRSARPVEPAYVKPIDEGSDKTCTYAYNSDELYPFPEFMVDESSWPEIVRRVLQKELLSEDYKLFDGLPSGNPLGGALLDGRFRHRRLDILLKPDLLSTCEEILNDLMDNSLSNAFSAPVNAREFPNYNNVVQRPMDLNTIKERISSGHYNEDVELETGDYAIQLEMPVVKLEDKEEADDSEESENEEEQNVSEGEEDEEEEESNKEGPVVGDDGRVMEYIISRKVRKYGKWKQKTEYQLSMELKKKEQEVWELTEDQRYYKHDCRGAGHKGVLADVRQVWRNCRVFNKSFTRIVKDSVKLEEIFYKQYERRILRRDPTENGQLEEAISEDAKFEKNALSQSFRGSPPVHQTLPSSGEIFNLLSEVGDYSLLPLTYKIGITSWLLDKTLETSKVKALLISRNDRLQQLEREEFVASKLQVKVVPTISVENGSGKDISEVKAEVSPLERQETFLSQCFDNNCRFEPIGYDKNFNRYYGVYPLAAEAGWLLMQNAKTGVWGYFSTPEQISKLIGSLDKRGKRENQLHRQLTTYWQPLLTKTQNKVKSISDRILDGLKSIHSITPEQQETRKQELQEKKIELEVELNRVLPEGKQWLDAAADGGKVYYYHAVTRETTWDLPVARKQKEQLEKEIAEVKQQIEVLSETHEERLKSLEQEAFNDGVLERLVHSIPESSPNPEVVSGHWCSITCLSFQLRIVELFALLKTMEALTLGPSCIICYAQNHRQWISKQRSEWLDNVDDVLDLAKSPVSANIRKRVTRFDVPVEVTESLSHLGKTDDDVSNVVLDVVEKIVARSPESFYDKMIRLPPTDKIITYSIENWDKVLVEAKTVMKSLYKQYTGNPYNVDQIKAQEAIVRAMRHECRWQRGVDNATSLAQLGLMEAQLRHILGLKTNAKYKRTLKSEMNTIAKILGISLD